MFLVPCDDIPHGVTGFLSYDVFSSKLSPPPPLLAPQPPPWSHRKDRHQRPSQEIPTGKQGSSPLTSLPHPNHICRIVFVLNRRTKAAFLLSECFLVLGSDLTSAKHLHKRRQAISNHRDSLRGRVDLQYLN